MGASIQDFETAIAGYLAGESGSNELKSVLAPAGIYEQRNALFMLRVRITGGHLESDALRSLARVMECNDIPWCHLSSRQTIQLHDVKVSNIINTMRGCQEMGMPFKGGGGNTYRNILVSPDAGLACDEIFDVLPYAETIHQTLARRTEAFLLPRKFKVGLFSKPSEVLQAAVQDLGFLAAMSGGRRGFTVYGGGGLGRESGLGVKLFDFLPDDQAVRCALAMLHLFNDHGDRINRQQARLRFVLKNKGAEEFVRLFHFYFEKTVSEPIVLPANRDYTAVSGRRAECFEDASTEEGYDTWKWHAVGPTKFGPDQVTVRLYVPYGNLTPEQCRGLAAVADDFGGGFLRLMTSQDMLMGPVPVELLSPLYTRLIREFPGLDLTLRSFRGHIGTCVGSAVCKIGILPAPALADSIAAHCDSWLPADTPEKLRRLRQLTDEIRISGCPNSCSGHPAARLGFQGMKRRRGDKIEEVVLPFTGCVLKPDGLRLSSCGDGTSAITLDRFPAVVAEALS